MANGMFIRPGVIKSGLTNRTLCRVISSKARLIPVWYLLKAISEKVGTAFSK